MNRLRFAFVAFFAFTLTHAALAADRREVREVSGFRAVSMAANMDLEVLQDGTESLVLEGEADVLDKLDTFVKDGTLNFKYKPNTSWWSPKRVHGVLHARRMDVVALSGAGRITSPSLKGDALTLALSGAGDIDVRDVATKRARLVVSGNGNVRVAGHADEVESRLSGSGDIGAGRLEARRAQVSLSGVGSVTVWPKETLAAAVSGAGRVRYYGDPAVTKSLRGVGSVTRVASNP